MRDHGGACGSTGANQLLASTNRPSPNRSCSCGDRYYVEASVRAISTQLLVAYDDAITAALRSGHATQPGATTYTGTCANCHGLDGKGFGPYTPALSGNPVVLDNDPSSLINLVLNGSNPLVVRGTPDPYRMPQFRMQYSDREIADVVTFIRNGWGNQAPAVGAEDVAKLRKSTDATSDQVIILKMR
jgi:alcohol dehydrogenase (quinone), cytochrome c subunit